MRQVDGGVFLNEPNVWLIEETIRKLFNESVAKECRTELEKVTVIHKDTGEIVPPGRRKGSTDLPGAEASKRAAKAAGKRGLTYETETEPCIGGA